MKKPKSLWERIKDYLDYLSNTKVLRQRISKYRRRRFAAHMRGTTLKAKLRPGVAELTRLKARCEWYDKRISQEQEKLRAIKKSL